MPELKKQPKHYSLHIPVKPQVKQFLLYHFGADYKMSFRDFLGPYMMGIFQKNIDWTWDIDQNEYSEKYKVITTDKFFLQYQVNSLSNYQIHLFNRFIIELFNDRMVDFIHSLEMLGIDNKKAILHWCERYQLDEGSEDWYQTFKKNYYRNKNKYKKSVSKVSPTISIQKITLAS